MRHIPVSPLDCPTPPRKMKITEALDHIQQYYKFSSLKERLGQWFMNTAPTEGEVVFKGSSDIFYCENDKDTINLILAECE